MNALNELKSYLRDINLEILMESPEVNIDISKRYHKKFRLFYPSRKLIKYVTNIGGVLSGSRALRCYTINGKPILERRVNDWDFVVTLEMAFKICDEMKISEIPKVGSVISIKNQRRYVHPSYSDSFRIGPVDVQLIIRDDLPEYKEINGIRIANFGYSVNSKVSTTYEIYNEICSGKFGQSELRSQYDKHIEDLKEIIIKYNSIKNANTD